MKKGLLFWLVIFAFIFIFIIIYFNINTSDTIKYNSTTINIKHPINYTLNEKPVFTFVRPEEKKQILKKEYSLKVINDLFPVKIKLFTHCEYSPRSFIMDFSEKYADILSFSPNKSESDICAEFKSKRNDTLVFIRVIKTKDCTIEIIASKPDMVRFSKMKYKKEVEIIKSIQIIDSGENNL